VRRQLYPQQQVLVPSFSRHEHGLELAEIGRFLDSLDGVEELVEADLLRGASAKRGRRGLTARQVLRVVVLKQMKGHSYEQLAFHLSDSQSYRAFCELELCGKAMKRATLQDNVAKISPRTWERINVAVVQRAKRDGVDDGERVRIDCTTVETNVHPPSDSSLLVDVVRITSSLLRRADKHATFSWSNHLRLAKRRGIAIIRARSKAERRARYRDLVRVTERVLGFAAHAVDDLASVPSSDAQLLHVKLKHIIEIGGQVINQTRRRVFEGEKVLASDKIVSVVEPHTSVIIKSREEVIYGHKICLNIGVSGLVIDCVVHDGNPSDATMTEPMIRRQRQLLGDAPRQAAFDGAFASGDNLTALKELGVEDVVFTKSRGLRISEMASSSFIYQALRRFRAGVEGCISFFKRCFGLDRCTWKGFPSFLSYVQASVLSANLLLIARHRLA